MEDTIRVRIAVGINRNGEWAAYGSSSSDDDDAAFTVVEGWGYNTPRFVEADIPLPVAETVEGEIIQSEEK
jgi:hypothetical protein